MSKIIFFRQRRISLGLKKTNKLNNGFTLVETLVAISIFTVSLLGMMSVLGSSIANTNYAKQKMLATYLAQEGIEYVRNMRDTAILYTKTTPKRPPDDWISFINNLNKCNPDNGCGFVKPALPLNFFVCNNSNPSSCELYVNNNGGYESYNNNPIGTDSGFVRKVWMTKADGSRYIGGTYDEIKIFSEVSWTQRSGNYKITFSENLFNWVEL